MIDKKEFVKAVLNGNFETFLIHVVTLEVPLSRMTIHSLQEARVAVLKQDETPTKIPAKYVDFSDVFSEKNTLVLPERTDLNEYAI